MARGGDDQALSVSTQSLARAIADYKKSAKSAKGLENQSKPKGKAKAKAAALPSS